MERRTSTRIPLDAPCLLTLIVEDTASYPAMLTDISRGGAQLALPPNITDGAVNVHARVRLSGVSGQISSWLEGASGHIVWVAHRHCGLRLDLDLPITDNDMARIFQL